MRKKVNRAAYGSKQFRNGEGAFIILNKRWCGRGFRFAGKFKIQKGIAKGQKLALKAAASITDINQGIFWFRK